MNANPYRKGIIMFFSIQTYDYIAFCSYDFILFLFLARLTNRADI